MQSLPVGRRTRLQRALVEKEMRERSRRARIKNRLRHRSELNTEHFSNDDDDDDKEEVKVVDKVEYLRRFADPGYGSNTPGVDVSAGGSGRKRQFEDVDDDDDDDDDDANSVNNDKGKGVMYDDGEGEGSDHSVEVIGQRWNPLMLGDDDDEDEDVVGGPGVSNVGGCQSAEPSLNDSKSSSTHDNVELSEDKEMKNTVPDTALEDGYDGLDDFMPAVDDVIPLKVIVPEKSEGKLESEELPEEGDFAFPASDVSDGSCLNEDEAFHSAGLQEKLCIEGKHYLIPEGKLGTRCKFCLFVKFEIRDVTPPIVKNEYPSERAEDITSGKHSDGLASDGFRFGDWSDEPPVAHSEGTQGTVWDLIPGTKSLLYPHQQEGFEFIWRNIGGGVKLDELDKPTKFGLGGCIICHAPGTGKTRLAITFLRSFIKQYPMSKPVIIAPRSMLLAWEEEFNRWDFGMPFLNMNTTELSGDEDTEVCFEDIKDTKNLRMTKLGTWAKGKGVLGISYTLFAKLAGEGKCTDVNFRQALLKQPGILILDEGHTPRNDSSNIWNVLLEVQTKRRIILSGTPFQNNFEELQNTLSLIREEFGYPFSLGKYVNCGKKSKLTDRRDSLVSSVSETRRIQELKDQMKPFVHVHKGEILRKTVRGLFHSVLFLIPSDLQKSCVHRLEGKYSGLQLEHSVSIACVHPSLLCRSDQVPNFVDKDLLKKYSRDLDAGVKIKFVFNLIQITKGEKLLVFSQYLSSLHFIGDLLKSHFQWTEGEEFLHMDGKRSIKKRQSYIELFNDPTSEARVLLASTKACSEGIHLVGASRVVLLDVVWNPSVERQAISRAYRLGQQKDVFVYHLIASGTMEEEKYYRQVAKDRLSEMVFSSMGEGRQEISSVSTVSEDRILEEMTQNETSKSIFKKIVLEPKAEELIETFVS